jgi:hypothetical protein
MNAPKSSALWMIRNHVSAADELSGRLCQAPSEINRRLAQGLYNSPTVSPNFEKTYPSRPLLLHRN